MRKDLLSLFFERRGYTDDFLSTLNTPVSTQFRNTDKFCRCLDFLKKANEQIVIAHDYDTDGVMAGVVSYIMLNDMGFDAKLYPLQARNGYGLQVSDVDTIGEMYPDATCILTCDNGVSCYDAIDYATERDYITIVTDHHIGNEDHFRVLPTCLVDPMEYHDTYEQPSVCGAFVVYRLLLDYKKQQIVKTLGDVLTDDMDRYFEADAQYSRFVDFLSVFVGIATVADNMVLWRDNRAMVSSAVSFFTYISDLLDVSDVDLVCQDHPYVNLPMYNYAYQGLVRLIHQLKQNGSIRDGKVTAETFGFYVAPLINTIKRFSEDTALLDSLFVYPEDSSTHPSEVQAGVLSVLYYLNQERKKLVAQYYQDIHNEYVSKYLEPQGCVMVSEASSGFLGLLAMRLMADYDRPFVVVKKQEDGSYNGSGRCPLWFDGLPLLSQLKGVSVAGHRGAFGISIHDDAAKERVDDLFARALDYVQVSVTDAKPYDICISTDFGSVLDCDVDDTDALYQFVSDVSLYEPFGQGFEKPIVGVYVKDIENMFIPMGNGNHCKARVSDDFSIVCFGDVTPCGLSGSYLFTGTLQINEWNGYRSLQLIVRDFDEVETTDSMFTDRG